MIDAKRWCRWLAIGGVLLSGCTTGRQDPGKALIREPGERHYGQAEDVRRTATEIAPFAALSANVYRGSFNSLTPLYAPPGPLCEQLSRSERQLEGELLVVNKCLIDPVTALAPLLEGWRKWDKFPSEVLVAEGRKLGLYLEVWQTKAAPYTIAVVFKGTRFSSFADWSSNLRWMGFLLPRSFHQDQYTLVGEMMVREFVDRFEHEGLAQSEQGEPSVQIIATGHSLGGGLAQYFAYSLTGGDSIPAVSRVYAFDSSPVTGWSQVPRCVREKNAKDLTINRVFEHGEILAYIRLLVERLHLRRVHGPSIRKVRYDFVKGNPITAHSMLRLACELGIAAGKVNDISPGLDLKSECDEERAKIEKIDGEIASRLAGFKSWLAMDESNGGITELSTLTIFLESSISTLTASDFDNRSTVSLISELVRSHRGKERKELKIALEAALSISELRSRGKAVPTLEIRRHLAAADLSRWRTI